MPKEARRLRELFRKVRANFCRLPCDTCQEPHENYSEKHVQMNFYILGGFYRVDSLPVQNPWKLKPGFINRVFVAVTFEASKCL